MILRKIPMPSYAKGPSSNVSLPPRTVPPRTARGTEECAMESSRLLTQVLQASDSQLRCAYRRFEAARLHPDLLEFTQGLINHRRNREFINRLGESLQSDMCPEGLSLLQIIVDAIGSSECERAATTSTTNWLPWVLGGGALVAVIAWSRRRDQ